MKIVAVTRYFENIPQSDFILIDMDKCTTPEEIIFRDEILNFKGEHIESPSSETLDILTGHNMDSYTKLNIGMGVHKINGTIQYGPTVII